MPKDDPNEPDIPEAYGTWAMLNRLASGDLTKFDAILEMPYIVILNQLGLFYHQDTIDRWRYKKANK